SSTRSSLCLSFFFQAEDGIRDRNVTGVQTCALPIFIYFLFGINRVRTRARLFAGRHLPVMHFISYEHAEREPSTTDALAGEIAQIGRASCRERGENPAGERSDHKQEHTRGKDEPEEG